MDDFVNILVFKHEIESQVLANLLTEQGIPFQIQSYHDLAYDGLFQFQKGWGVLWAPESHRDEILRLYDRMEAGE